eukprot:365949-Chlamydomonas_euryale.AAC.7
MPQMRVLLELMPTTLPPAGWLAKSAWAPSHPPPQLQLQPQPAVHAVQQPASPGNRGAAGQNTLASLAVLPPMEGSPAAERSAGEPSQVRPPPSQAQDSVLGIDRSSPARVAAAAVAAVQAAVTAAGSSMLVAPHESARSPAARPSEAAAAAMPSGLALAAPNVLLKPAAQLSRAASMGSGAFDNAATDADSAADADDVARLPGGALAAPHDSARSRVDASLRSEKEALRRQLQELELMSLGWHSKLGSANGSQVAAMSAPAADTPVAAGEAASRSLPSEARPAAPPAVGSGWPQPPSPYMQSQGDASRSGDLAVPQDQGGRDMPALPPQWTLPFGAVRST